MTPDPEIPDSAAPPAAEPAVDAAALQRQIDELKEQVAEGQRTAQYWADKAKASAPQPRAAEVPEEDEPDVLEAITTKGAKGFDELASKRGFVRKDEVEALIANRAASLTKEQELLGRYPDLKKKDSEFFKATALHYGDLVKAGTPQAVAMELAAEKAELDFMRTGKLKPAGSEATKEEKEAARLARIKAQSAGGGGRQPAPDPEEDDELTPEQKRIADAMGVSHEAYKKRAKAGVAMRGLK
jgi:hypothetical protein